MAGAAVVFFFGFPQPDLRHVRVLESSPSDAEIVSMTLLRRRLSYAGIVLLFIGFALQFVGVVV